jgi:hypothetical protein
MRLATGCWERTHKTQVRMRSAQKITCGDAATMPSPKCAVRHTHAILLRATAMGGRDSIVVSMAADVRGIDSVIHFAS